MRLIFWASMDLSLRVHAGIVSTLSCSRIAFCRAGSRSLKVRRNLSIGTIGADELDRDRGSRVCFVGTRGPALTPGSVSRVPRKALTAARAFGHNRLGYGRVEVIAPTTSRQEAQLWPAAWTRHALSLWRGSRSRA